MKLAVIGIFLVSSCIVASEAQIHEGGPYGEVYTGASAPPPPAYVQNQPGHSRITPPQGDTENSHNCVMCDCRGAQFCCAGDSSGNDSCIIACCSTLVKQLSGSELWAEADKPAQD